MLLGLLFTLLFILCSVPLLIVFAALFSLVSLPFWLEAGISAALSLAGGLVGQAVVIESLDERRSWRRWQESQTAAMVAVWLTVAIGAGAATGIWWLCILLSVPLSFHQGVTGVGGMLATTYTITHLSRKWGYSPPGHSLTERLWSVLDVCVVVLLTFGPPLTLTLLQEGRFAMESQLEWPHLLLMFVGAGVGLVFHFRLKEWLWRTRGLQIWGDE